MLHLEDLALDGLARDLAGRPAWVLSAARLRADLAALGPRTVPVRRLGPPALLRLAVEAGWWAAASSTSELERALAAGFPPERCGISGRVKEDGLVVEALAGGVGVIAAHDAEDARNVARIAELLGLEVPPTSGGPPLAPASAFAACGGLLARVLRGGDETWIDAPLPDERELRDEDAFDLLPVTDESAPDAAPDAAPRTAALFGLSRGSSDRPWSVRLYGELTRGDAVLLVAPGGLAARAEDPTHPEPEVVLVQGAFWRPLERRPPPTSLGPSSAPRPP